MKISSILVLTLFISPAYAAVYKCKEGDKVVYTEIPCTFDSKPEKIKESYVPDPRGLTKAQIGALRHNQSVLDEQKWERKVFLAIRQNNIIKGMTYGDVRRSWGAPDDINSTTGSYGTHQQWVYRRGVAQSQFVYFENGVVTGWGD
ncbi:hypothetical protein [Pseudoalteromonas sp. T1lg22]|uniref:hypothetical protein n=1 Tax=Pseudoalteromonas sp. T1lg22 TaxID=2077096 RepID=UPI000CF73E4F|nr:hypothetical protein [Pseudoalteromonas sp. T1lg22]